MLLYLNGSVLACCTSRLSASIVASSRKTSSASTRRPRCSSMFRLMDREVVRLMSSSHDRSISHQACSNLDLLTDIAPAVRHSRFHHYTVAMSMESTAYHPDLIRTLPTRAECASSPLARCLTRDAVLVATHAALSQKTDFEMSYRLSADTWISYMLDFTTNLRDPATPKVCVYREHDR